MVQSLFEEIGLDKVSEIMAAATAKAANKADQLGLPRAEQINGKWVFRYPDGSSEPILSGSFTHDYDPADSLVDSETVAVFLADAYDTGDAAFIAEAMAVVARAKIRIDADDEGQKPSF
ncbi:MULTISPECIES: hypothetical protein [unclassified Pseudomonas]|uniref:hypothetical protein n=1 Tax=unclassified Pseudomonas TaxID=196821 RepID=UPI002AC9BD4B|nr:MULTISPECIES: hypothetical protein [unclassified Pseudomonas]MEB0048096.1 hypothetical protein [Pseudomonas sp. Dout3]MEB0098760.1 hypothetical protein [Pseudomonas sp. DC1.2]WPX56737.1 hypothetical protein RHM68_13805 [Pseudomonas sp. DC1.2]